jgi:hypothetical protein
MTEKETEALARTTNRPIEGEPMKRINVIVLKPAERPFFHAQWVDPVSGRKKTHSLGTNIRRDAERAAANLAKELNDGTYRSPRTVEWSEFRTRYEDEIVPGARAEDSKEGAGNVQRRSSLASILSASRARSRKGDCASRRRAAVGRIRKRPRPETQFRLSLVRASHACGDQGDDAALFDQH